MSDTLPETDREEMMARHRKEKKELQSKIQSMKKMKVDKKKKKELQDEIASLEADIEKRHAEEMNRLNISESAEEPKSSEEDHPAENGECNTSEKAEPRASKAQRRREKKAQDDREREAQIKQEEEVLSKSSPRVIENNRINEILSKRGLKSHVVAADGDCLYNAIGHQLTLQGIGAYATPELRTMAADYIEANRDTMICYMSHPDTGDMLSPEEFDKYCHQVRATKSWGGELEIKALSSSLKCPIEIIQAVGPSTVHGEEESKDRKLILTYHRHMYRLGEHYNSTQPLPTRPDENED
ncbi:AGAP006160-PA-like protein [Anopheles sinensis]|uniref:AGAP006160-PA-like protein n=1 Tax=Anopheles sinensis TaxID=74873 RepID=A0A084WEN8_ANOSI|nr:AGAP006160-PA-like protein [Anopheles sinensis]